MRKICYKLLHNYMYLSETSPPHPNNSYSSSSDTSAG